MGLNYFVISDLNELVKHRENILTLFSNCFSESLDKALWDWAYLKNPLGAPVVSLCYTDDNTLVGHYATIPYYLRNSTDTLSALLSMTTMVHPSHRKHGLFTKQASDVYSTATDLGYQYVFGFPNKMSVSGFRKRLGWDIHKSDKIVSMRGIELKKIGYVSYVSKKEAYSIDEELIEWRLAKPNNQYLIKNDSLILKEYNESYDILLAKEGCEEFLEDDRKYNVLIDYSIVTDQSITNIPYIFGSKVLSNHPKFSKSLSIKKSLILSDIF